MGIERRGIPGPVRRADAAPRSSATSLLRCWTIRNMPTGLAFGLKGDTGITILEGEAA